MQAVQHTGATPAKNTANAAGALRNALTACNTLEGKVRNAQAGQQEILRETVNVRLNPQMSNYFVHTICQQI